MKTCNVRSTVWLLASVTALCVQAVGRAEPIKLRPPAVPLVAHDPYFSIWSEADALPGVGTTNWVGRPYPLRSLLRVDGKPYRVMGVEPVAVPALPQTDVTVYPTRTVYRFGDTQITLTLTFLTPALPSELDVLARPLTYLVWDVQSVDGQSHAVQLYFDAGAELAVEQPIQKVVWDEPAIEGLDVLKLGTQRQPVLGAEVTIWRSTGGISTWRPLLRNTRADDCQWRRCPQTVC